MCRKESFVIINKHVGWNNYAGRTKTIIEMGICSALKEWGEHTEWSGTKVLSYLLYLHRTSDQVHL